jgi:Rad3-related DNA helicase
MWSLHQKNGEKEEFLEPLIFSNGKTQEDIVREVVQEIKNGIKVIFIKGVCGTGKSSIALNIAKEIGRASVVVPVKTLQNQYENDYMRKKWLMKNGKKLKINIITGRQNHICPFFNEEGLSFEKTERNSTLNDIGKVRVNRRNDTCDNPFLPCRIDLKDKNMGKIKNYLKKNPKVKASNFNNAASVRRLSIAPVCPYWSPIIPAEIDLGILEDAKKEHYKGLQDREYSLYRRKPGCGYYDQFESYVNSDVIIFNSEKYKIETLMNRKPATDVEIIDECDEFLDSLSNQEKINLNRLSFSLGTLYPEDAETNERINETIETLNKILKDKSLEEQAKNQEIIPLKQTEIYSLLKKFLDSEFMNSVECDEENYSYHADKVARTFFGFFNETYVSFHKEERDLFVKLVTTNLEKRFKELLDKNKVLILMSGTIHSENVLKEIFGISNFKIVEAETEMPGKISEFRTGYERNCKYSNFQNGSLNRGQYLFALSRCIAQAKKPLLVHVIAFRDLPTQYERATYNINMISQEELIEKQKNAEKEVEKFKKGEIDILYTTKCSRGVDFPGETCNSILLTRYPFPNVSSLFWKVLRLTNPEHYNSFYMDKSRREFLQKIYRGLRSKDDHIFLLSPDSRVFMKR